MAARATRMARELALLERDPPPGIWCGPTVEQSKEVGQNGASDGDVSKAKRAKLEAGDGDEVEVTAKGAAAEEEASPSREMIDKLQASILGAAGTPYEGGEFRLELAIPAKYPFEPPKVRFLTPIYHPNVDNVGRICLDLLKMPPAGSWRPSQNIVTVLKSLQLLMAEPNPEDGLMADIASEYKYNRAQFMATAKEWVKKHASQQTASDKPAT
eukprot:m.240399 g.240399  ORF g.240399 m.240399 type:complete len:213 (+) comp23364_c0_seq1:12-650(+)